MTTNMFPEVTLLITHYNRSCSLERLLSTLKNLGLLFDDIVVSDDGSKPEHQEKLRLLQNDYRFRLITSERNRGLGHNFNKGQDAVQTEYTLCIQEDFVPNPEFVPALGHALEFIKQRPDIDMARFYAYFKYPYLKPIGKGFSEMQFSPWAPGYKKFYMYSDHPHLRRSDFFKKFGRYKEGIKPDITEYKMMQSFLRHNGKAIYFDRFQDLIDQVNSNSEPSTIRRNFWRETDNTVIGTIRHIYRHLKMNLDYMFGN